MVLSSFADREQQMPILFSCVVLNVMAIRTCAVKPFERDGAQPRHGYRHVALAHSGTSHRRPICLKATVGSVFGPKAPPVS